MYKFTSTCPRCGTRSLEILSTHSFCAGCNYSPDLEVADLHTHEQDPIYELDERARCSDEFDDENEEDEEEGDEYRWYTDDSTDEDYFCEDPYLEFDTDFDSEFDDSDLEPYAPYFDPWGEYGK